MVAAAFPMADVILREPSDPQGADSAGDAVSPDELPFPPTSANAGDSDPATAGPDDASSVPGSLANGFASSGTGSAMLDQVLGAAALAGLDVEVPDLPVARLAAVNPLRPAILEWIAATGAVVDPVELDTELARADALPQSLQRDLALVVLSAAEATRLQALATAALSPEQIAWLHAHPEVASELARGVVNEDTQILARLAGLVDTRKSLQAALLMLQAAEATRGSLADAKLADATDALPTLDVAPHMRQLLLALAGATTPVSDAQKLRFAAEIVALGANVEMPAPAAPVAFGDAVAALMAATGQTADAAALQDVLRRASLLPDDLESALAGTIAAQAAAVGAANPAVATPQLQSQALVGVLLAASDAMPALQKYSLYWRNAPEALRTSTWDSEARVGWAVEHAALVAATGGDLADLVRAGALVQGGTLVDAAAPSRSFEEAFRALSLEGGHTPTSADLDVVARAGQRLAPEVRQAAAVLMSGAAESARLTRVAFAELDAAERGLLVSTDVGALLAKPQPTGEEIALLALTSDLAARVDRPALAMAGVVAARAAMDAQRILSSPVATQAALVAPVDTGFGALLSRLLPLGLAGAQAAPGECVPMDDLMESTSGGIISLGTAVGNDCERDILLSVERPPVFTGVSSNSRSLANDTTTCYELESPNQQLLVITGSQGTSHVPQEGVRISGPKWPDNTCPRDTGLGSPGFPFFNEKAEPAPAWGAPVVSIDLGGSDTYMRPVAVTVPGGWLPVSIHLDLEGSDYYSDPTNVYDAMSPIFRRLPRAGLGHPTQGSTAGTGVAILLDGAGDDRYDAPSWSQGFGRWGVGMLADLTGGDSYSGAQFVQGAASESWNLGIGALVDVDGDDGRSAMSGQGYGVGGILVDLGGTDRYFADEEPKGVPVVHLEVVPGGDVTTFDERADGLIWLDGPEALNPGIAVDVERTTSGTDSDGDGDSDFVEFLAGSDPNNPRETADDGPNARIESIALDSDLDLFPDFIERALSTDPQDPASYPAGIPRGHTLVIPLLGPQTVTEVLGGGSGEGTPRGGDKVVDLRLPLQDAGTIDRACTGDVLLAANVTSPFEEGGSGVPSLVDDDADDTYSLAASRRPNQCLLFSYATEGDGTGNGTKPGFDDPQKKQEFTFRLPAGILAIGDAVSTRYDIEYWLAIDLGGDDEFANHAGGPLVATTKAGPEVTSSQNLNNFFLAPSLVLNVDVASAGTITSADGGLGDDVYVPRNATIGNAPQDYAHGSLLGVLIDTAGDDRYVAGNASQGALGGVLLDLAGADRYFAGNSSQGAAVFVDAQGTTGGREGYLEEGATKPPTMYSDNRAAPPVTASSFLLDLGGADKYAAGWHSQGFARGFCGSPCPPFVGLLFDNEGDDNYTTYWRDERDNTQVRGAESQGVATDGGLAVLLDAAGNDGYVAWTSISQANTVSTSRGKSDAQAATMPPSVAAAALIDLGGLDNYTYFDRNGEHWERTKLRANSTTISRGPQSALVSSTRMQLPGQPGVHLDAESSNGVGLVDGIMGAPDGVASTDGFLLNLPTARLAIGGTEPTTYVHEYALVIDQGGSNDYRFNAGGFVPEVSLAADGSQTAQVGGYGYATSGFPVTLVLDAGSDASRYTSSNLLSQGAGFFSVGLVVDAGGADVLTAKPLSLPSHRATWMPTSVGIAVDGIITDAEWNFTQPMNLTLAGLRDDRYAQDWSVRLANDGTRLFIALEGTTSSRNPSVDFATEALEIQLNPGHTLKERVSATQTGIDGLLIPLSTPTGTCIPQDTSWWKNGTAFGMNKDVVNGAYASANHVTAACRYNDGKWSIEIIKPLAPDSPEDPGDFNYFYDDALGFLNDVDVGFRIQFKEGVTQERYAYPAGTYAEDGQVGYRKDGSLSDELAAWAAFSLANRGENSPLPANTRVAALSQGAGLAGIGVVAMVGLVDSDAVYTSSERSQGYANFGGIGLILDLAGNDQYHGSTLVQGAAQFNGSVGMLVDVDGNDRYVSLTRANGYGQFSGAGHFADLNGLDDYRSFGFSPRPTPDCIGTHLSTSNSTCEHEPGVVNAKGNQKSWRHGDYGVGVDYLSNDDARSTLSAAESLLYGQETKLKFYLPNETGECAGPLAPLPLDGKLARYVLSGEVCAEAVVAFDQGPKVGPAGSLGAATTSVVGVDSLAFVVDRAVFVVKQDFQALDNGARRYLAKIDSRAFPDGVKAIAAVATFRVQVADGGVVLIRDPYLNDPEGTSHRRVVMNNEPTIQLGLSPVVSGVSGAVFSPVSNTRPRNLTIDWSVGHDGNEDRIETIHGYKPFFPELRNVPCATPDDTDLCTVLPFFFMQNTGADNKMQTEPANEAALTKIEQSNTNAILTQSLATLRTPLVVSKHEGLVVRIPGRTAVTANEFNTSFRISVLDAEGDPLVVDGQRVYLARQSFFSTQSPAPSDVAGALAGPYEAAQEQLEALINLTRDALANDALLSNYDRVLNDFVCPNKWSAGGPMLTPCQNFYGNYGYSSPSTRVCNPETFVNRDASLLAYGAGLCTTSTPANLTRATVASASPTVQELAGGPLLGAIDTAGALLAPTSPAGENWTVFHLDVLDHPLFSPTSENVTLPAGYGLQLEMFTQVSGLGAGVSVQKDVYEGVFLSNLDEALGTANGVQDPADPLGATGGTDNDSRLLGVDGELVVAPPAGLSPRRLPLSVVPTDTVSFLAHNNTNISALDAIIGAPAPVAVFSYGGTDGLARVEVKTPAEPQTSVKITLRHGASGASVTLVDDVRPGDVEGSGSLTTLVEGFLEYGIDPAKPRYTQFSTLFNGTYGGSQLPDGEYAVTVTAYEPYSDTVVTRTGKFILDRTPPDSRITTPDRVGSQRLVNGNVPVAWSVTEIGSGVERVYVYSATRSPMQGEGAADVCLGGSTVQTYGDWKLVGAYRSSLTSDFESVQKPDGALYLLSIAEDRAGNIENAPLDAKLCEALAKTVERQEWKAIAIDETAPVVGSPSIVGSRPLNFQGREYDFVRAGSPVTFQVCARSLRGGDTNDISAVLVYFDLPVGNDIEASYAYEASPSGSCKIGVLDGVLYQYSGWSAENVKTVAVNNTTAPLFRDGLWTIQFVVIDQAGNSVKAHAGDVILDSRAPTAQVSAPIYPVNQAAVKGGDAVIVRVLPGDEFGVDERATRVDARALNVTGILQTRTARVDGLAYQEVSFRVDKPDIANGNYTLPITVSDNAGNVLVTNVTVRVDFTRFEIVEGSVRVENVTHNTAVLRWETTEDATSAARYSISSAALGGQKELNLTLVKVHEIQLTGLASSTRYHVRAVSSSAGGYIVESPTLDFATLTALYIDAVSPAPGSAVSGNVPLRFDGGLRDSDEYVTFTLYAKSPHKADNWTFVTTITRQGDTHEILWNSSRYLDGDGYMLRVEAVADADKDFADFGPLLADNGLPSITVIGPGAATNDSTPAIDFEARDNLAGFGTEDPKILLDGREISGLRVTRNDSRSLRATYQVDAPLFAGPHEIEISLRDLAGNVAKRAWTVSVDADAPIVRANALRFAPGTTAARAGGQVILNLSVVDASGVDAVAVDASELTPGLKSVALVRGSAPDLWTGVVDVAARDAGATKRVYVTAEDVAGNRRTIAVEVPIDNAEPDVAGATVADVGYLSARLVVAASSEPITLAVRATAPGAPDATAATLVASKAPSVTIENLLPSRRYSYELRAIDGAGNAALLVGSFNTLADTKAPSAMGALTHVDLLNGTLRLRWTASTDDVGVAFYRLYRSDDGGKSFAAIAEVKGLSYDDGQLPYEKSFTYKVAAVDHGGNEGPASQPLTTVATAVPRLSAGAASPTVGTTATVFRYTVTYASVSGKAPASVRVLIDGVPHEMTRQDQAGSFDKGVTYVYETRLAPHTRDAPHTYQFEASDGRYTAKFPEDGKVLRGPLVSAEAFAADGEGGFASFAQRVPVTGLAGITLAVVAAALIAALVVRKKKMGGSK